MIIVYSGGVVKAKNYWGESCISYMRSCQVAAKITELFCNSQWTFCEWLKLRKYSQGFPSSQMGMHMGGKSSYVLSDS